MKFKKIGAFFFLIFVVCLNQSYSQNPQCDHLFESDATVIDGIIHNINPGETVCLKAGIYVTLTIRDVIGTAEDPITIINKDGPVNINNLEGPFGMKLDSCKHVIVTGTGKDDIDYGIRVMRAEGAAVSLDGFSSDIEIRFMELSNTSEYFGALYAKTDPNCINYKWYPSNWVMENISIHDCYIHDIGQEGLYIGSSKYGVGHEIYCDEQWHTIQPHVLKNVEIYNNRLVDIGWDGIQVSTTIENCKIHHNEILRDSKAEHIWQMSGILSGGGSKCDIYNNFIRDGKGGGIEVFGLGNQKIYNNVIIRPGKSYMPGEPAIGEYQKHGIFIGNLETHQGSGFYVYNNTIVSPRTYGVNLTNEVAMENKVINNLIVEPGAYEQLQNQSYIVASNGITFVNQNNFTAPSVFEAQFISTSQHNYDLKLESPAINYGRDLSAEGVTTDYLDRIRPFATKFDAGAYEADHPSIGIEDLLNRRNGAAISDVYPNPVTSSSSVQFYIPDKRKVDIRLTSELGKEMKIIVNKEFTSGTHIVNFQREGLSDGLYFIIFKSESDFHAKKIIIQ